MEYYSAVKRREELRYPRVGLNLQLRWVKESSPWKRSPTRRIHLYRILGNANKPRVTDKTAVVAWRQGQKERWITKGHKETLGGDKSLSFMWVSFPRCYIYHILHSNMCSLCSSIILQVERSWRFKIILCIIYSQRMHWSLGFSLHLKAKKWHFITHTEESVPFPCSLLFTPDSWQKETTAQGFATERKIKF